MYTPCFILSLLISPDEILLFKNSEIIIFNGDNELVVNKINDLYLSKKLISFGLKHSNNIYIKNDWKNKNEDLKIRYFDEDFSVPVQQRDEATLSNVLCVIAVLKEYGFSTSKIIEKLNLLANSKVEFSENDLQDIIK